ncbi:hypothetical protein Ciccas_011691, partial [Cichlidogyrus casuarinus]
EFCKSIDSMCEVHETADSKCCSPMVCNTSKRYGKCAKCADKGNLCSSNTECCGKRCHDGRCK